VGRGLTVLLGAQGAGKTRLMRLLLGIEAPREGTLTVAGCSLPRQAIAARAKVGYVSESPAFYPDMTGVQLSQFLGGVYRRWKPKRFYELLARLGVPARRRIEALSPSLRARLALGAALAIEPELLLVDVPSELDALGRHELLLGVREERGSLPTLVATSRPAEVQGLAERVLVLGKGSLLYDGPPVEFGAEGQSLEAAYLERLRR
jgi:ABC-2 type transport system ATP-binding protein